MTVTDPTTVPTTGPSTGTPPVRAVTFDLYRDIHKGIRSELFAVVEDIGRTDPTDAAARAAVAGHLAAAVALLDSHAEHEDSVMQPAIEEHIPLVAERIAADHHAFDTRTADLVARAGAVAAATSGQRLLLHALYLDTATFVGDYLAHQDLEERVVMPALEAAVGIDAVMAMHGAILASIPPDEMGRSLALMLPAMNLDDRAEMLGGMRAGAPPEVFAGVWDLAGSVLVRADRDALAQRLGLA